MTSPVRLQWFLSWLVFKAVVWGPWMLWSLLPRAGEYAYAEDFDWFCTNRDRLEGKITTEEFWKSHDPRA